MGICAFGTFFYAGECLEIDDPNFTAFEPTDNIEEFCTSTCASTPI